MTTLPDIELHINQLAELQREILLLDENSLGENKYLFAVIVRSHNLLNEMIIIANKNKNLEYFFNTISNALLELYTAAQPNQNNARPAQAREILQQLAITYQEALVPMLTRLHNLSQDSANMLRITSIASLGNEIINCSSQLYQFIDTLDTNQKIYAMLGCILMYAGIGLAITTLSGNTTDTSIIDVLTCITLGLALSRIAMEHYKNVPEADLTRTALANIPAAIAKIDKDPQEQAYLHKILSGDPEIIVVEQPSQDTFVVEQAPETAPEAQTLLQKMKSFMGFAKDNR